MTIETAPGFKLPFVPTLALIISLLIIAVPIRAQNSPYSEGLLPAVRRAAAIVPGDLPLSLHVLVFHHVDAPASALVENGSPHINAIAFPVFQILYSRGWIMVDSGMDRQLAAAFGDPRKGFSDARYSRVQLALRDARMIVLTHEHDDHAGGVIRSPYLARIEPKTLLTRDQLRTLMDHPNRPEIKLDPERAAHYLVVDYDRLLPIAPGVVLIKAPGHTPGSQMIYVRLKSGQEAVLSGDVAWQMSGIQSLHQKPEAVSKSLNEDRKAIGEELEWLHGLAAQRITVIVSHDTAQLTNLVRRGILKDDVDMRRP